MVQVSDRSEHRGNRDSAGTARATCLLDRGGDAAVLLFAAWTLAYHLALLFDPPTTALLAGWLAASAGAAAVLLARRRRRRG
ncbi:hypothetical protein, partial [Actinomadura fibrosa]